MPVAGARAWAAAVLLGEQVWTWREPSVVEREGGDGVATLLAGYEGNADGTAFTAANSDANGDTAATLTLNSGTTVYETSQAAHNSCSLQVTPSGTNSIFLQYTDAGTMTSGAMRLYVYMTGSPSATVDFPIRFVSSSNSTVATIQMTSGRILRISAGSSVQGTVALALNTWHRIEVQFANITGGSGTIDCQSFTGDGTSSTDSIGLTGLTLSAIQGVRLGKLTSGTVTLAAFYFDDFYWNTGSATAVGPFDPDVDAAAEGITVTAAANSATVQVAPHADVSAATAEALFDAANGSVSVTLTGQDAVNAVGTAHDALAQPSVVGTATEATAAGAANDAAVALGPTAGSTAAAAALDATTTVSLGSDVSTAAAAAQNAAASIAPPAGVAAATAAGEDATVSRAGNPNADVAAAAAAAHDAQGAVAPQADPALAAAATNDAVVSTSSASNAAPSTASALAEAADAAPSTSQPGPADVAAATGAAEDAAASISLAPDAEAATAVATAADATVITEGTTLAPAEAATVAAVAEPADTILVSIPASDVAVTAESLDASVLISAVALAEAAEATALTEDVVPTTVAVAQPEAEYCFGQGVAEDAAVDILTAIEVAGALAAALDAQVFGPPSFGTLRTGARSRPSLTTGPREEVPV